MLKTPPPALCVDDRTARRRRDATGRIGTDNGEGAVRSKPTVEL